MYSTRLSTTSFVTLAVYASSLLAIPLSLSPRQAPAELPENLLTLDGASNDDHDVVPEGFHVDPIWSEERLDPTDVYVTFTDSLIKLAKADRNSDIGPYTFAPRNVAIDITGAAAGLAPIKVVEAAWGFHQIVRKMWQDHRFNVGTFILYQKNDPIGTIRVRSRRPGTEDQLPRTIIDPSAYATSPALIYDPNNVKVWSPPTWGGNIELYEFYLPMCTMATLLSRIPTNMRNGPVNGVNLAQWYPTWNFMVSTVAPPPAAKITPNDMTEMLAYALNLAIPVAQTAELKLTLDLQNGGHSIATFGFDLRATPPQSPLKSDEATEQTPEMKALADKVTKYYADQDAAVGGTSVAAAISPS